MVHELPMAYERCVAVLNGERTFDVRLNSKEFQKGDRVQYRSFNAPNDEIEKHLFEITHVMSGGGIEKDYVVFAIKEI